MHMVARLPSEASPPNSRNAQDLQAISETDQHLYSPIGDAPCVVVNVEEVDVSSSPARCNGLDHAVIIGVDTSERPVAFSAEDFDVLLTTNPGRGRPFVEVTRSELDVALGVLDRQIRANPAAASILCQVLRAGSNLPYNQALLVESLGYSTLLGGGEFQKWLASRSDRTPIKGGPKPPPVLVDRVDDCVYITLNNAGERNAMSAAMRDALFEALSSVVDDPTEPDIVLNANGKCFSVGGELGEFGLSDDLALAHSIRSLRSCTRLLASLGDRASVRVHGACIGSGIEIAAAAKYRHAAAGAFIQLPEVSMGLIPGAGGTASLAKAIGRHRTAYLALSGKRFRAERLSGWGLFNSIGEPSRCR